MKKQTGPKLYFIAGAVPTDAERADAEQYGITAFRNVQHVHAAQELTSGVAGLVPACYAAAPRAEKQAWVAKLAEAEAKARAAGIPAVPTAPTGGNGWGTPAAS
jgi:hypothetical protein